MAPLDTRSMHKIEGEGSRDESMCSPRDLLPINPGELAIHFEGMPLPLAQISQTTTFQLIPPPFTEPSLSLAQAKILFEYQQAVTESVNNRLEEIRGWANTLNTRLQTVVADSQAVCSQFSELFRVAHQNTMMLHEEVGRQMTGTAHCATNLGHIQAVITEMQQKFYQLEHFADKHDKM